MKLGTRLSIVVGVIVTVLSLSIGTFAILYSERSEIGSVTSMLNASTVETQRTTDDPYSVALTVSDSSPLPLSAAIVTGAHSISYLADNSASLHNPPSSQAIARSLGSPVVVEKSLLIRSIKTGPNEYLIYSMSIASAQSHTRDLLRNLIYFVFIALLISITSTYLLFRRDSKINESANTLKESQARMQEFLGDASHELRSPLTVIKGYTELISKDPRQADVPRYLATMQSEILRMEKLIKDLLLLAELGESPSLELSEVNLNALIRRYVDELSDLSPKRPIALDLQDLVVHSDKRLLEILCANIFSNISRHTPPDAPVKVLLSSERNEILISVEDGGPGIAAPSPQLFSRFDKARSREQGGSGLGLSIISKIVHGLKGDISFTRGDLGGLKVEIRIPR